MQISVTVSGQFESRTLDCKDGSTALDILRILDLYPDEVIVISKVNQNKPVPADIQISSGDVLTIIPVASGG